LILPKVELRSNESQEQLLRRFRKEVMKSKVLADIRRKRWFVSKSELNRIKNKKAARRQRRTQRRTPAG
jgi:small subunit ribosomal protein S21